MDKIRLIQFAELDACLELDRICREHGIEYSLAWGSLLGAVRHHGSIPWDDDFDVQMKREDYDRFCSLLKQGVLKDDFTYIFMEPDNDCPYLYAKILVKGTHLIDRERIYHQEYEDAAWVDVFPFERTSSNGPSKSMKRKLYRNHSLYVYMTGSQNYHHKGLMKLGEDISRAILRVFPGKKRIKAKIDKILAEENAREGNNAYVPMDFERNVKYIIDESLIDAGVIYVDYEGYKLPIYKEYDKILTILFGDYMTPPSEEDKAKVSEPHTYDLGDYVPKSLKGREEDAK